MKHVNFILAAAVAAAAWADPYLETSKKQAVNTGYYPGPKTKIVVDWAYTDTDTKQQRVFGTWDSGNRTLLYAGSYINGAGGYSWAMQDYAGNWSAFRDPQLMVTTDRRTVVLDCPNNLATITDAAGLVESKMTTRRTNLSNSAIILFAVPNDLLGQDNFTNFGALKFYSMQIYEDGVLVHDYRPRAWNGEGVVYDTVANVAFKSATDTPLAASEDCEAFTGTPLADSSTANGLYKPTVPADGLVISGVNTAGPCMPIGDRADGNSGTVTFQGSNTFGGGLVMYYAPRTVSPREYTQAGWSKNYTGGTDANVQMTYAVKGDPNGLQTFAGSFDDYTAGQRGDVVLLDGNFAFGGNVAPNGNDGYLVFKPGTYSVGSLNWMSGHGHNSRLIVDAGATVSSRGDMCETGVGAGNPFHLYVDGTLSIGGTLSPYAGSCSIQGSGTVNAHAFLAGTMGSPISIPHFNLGTGGASCIDTKFGATTLGCYDGSTALGGTYSFASTTLNCALPDGSAADISLEGAPTAAGELVKNGPGALVIGSATMDGLTGGLVVRSGSLLFNVPAELKCPVTVAAGAGIGATATGKGSFSNLKLADGAVVMIEARADGIGEVTLPAGAIQGALTVRIDGAQPPAAATVATILKGANLTAADLANITLEVEGGQMEGELSVEDGNLKLTVTKSSTAAARTLTWTAAESTTWDNTAVNWLDALGAATAFRPFDHAVFGDVDGTVTVAAGVQPGSLTFNGEGRTYTFAGEKLAGAADFTVDNGATVELAAPLDMQTIVVKNGVLKPGVTDENLLGSPNVPLTVLDGGTFDLNNRAGDVADRLMTHNKKYRIAGEGATAADGTKMGAIVNTGSLSDTLGRVHTIELIGDAMVKGGTERWDMRKTSEGANTDRPQMFGEHTLTIGGSSVVMVDTDVKLNKVVVEGGALWGIEGSSTEDLKEGLLLKDGQVRFWSHANPFAQTIVADGPAPRINTGAGTTKVTGEVHVTEGSTLNMRGENLACTTFLGGIFGPGALAANGDMNYLACDVEQDEILANGTFLCYGDQTAEGINHKFPKTIKMKGGYMAFQPGTNSVFRGYTFTPEGTATSYFMPSRVGMGMQESRIEDTVIEGDTIGLALGVGRATDNNNYQRQQGWATLGQGFVANNLNGILMGFYQTQPADARLTIATGATVKMKAGTTVLLGQWSGITNNTHELVVDGGTFDASEADVYAGYDTRVGKFVINDGNVKLKDVWLRKQMTQDNVKANPLNGLSYEIFAINGGRVELNGNITTVRGYPWLPQFWFGGGTLTSPIDWSTHEYQVGTFETWGDTGVKNTFTLETAAGKTVNFRSPLQGSANVKLTGEGSFTADYTALGGGAQGGVTGHWTVENTGTTVLKNAAAFADGLTLGENAQVSIDIGARTDYAAVAVQCRASSDNLSNEFGNDTFWSAGNVYPSLFTPHFQKLITLDKTPTYTAFRQEVEFYVPTAETYTFAATYDDRCDISVDGAIQATNGSEWNGVGVKSVALSAGWHRLNVTAKDDAGGAGPVPADWKAKRMAAGFHIGTTTSKSADDYEPIDGQHLKMRPVSSVRWSYKAIGAQADLKNWPDTDYTFTMVTNSMQKLHATSWNNGGYAVNAWSFWTFVEPEQAGEWNFRGVYDDKLHVKLDDAQVFSNNSWNSVATSKANVSAGWHKFVVTACDYGGGISYSGVSAEGAALRVKRPGDADFVTFDERAIQMTAEPYGFIGRTLNVGAGAVLTNASDTPCDVYGTVTGTGTVEGPFKVLGTWQVDGLDEAEAAAHAVRWTGAADLSGATVELTVTGRPQRSKYVLSKGFTGVPPTVLKATLGGKATDQFQLQVVDGDLVLNNLKGNGMTIFLR